MGLWKHLDWRGVTHSGIGALQVPFLVKSTKMPLVNPKLIESQMRSRSSRNNIFLAFTSNWSPRRFLSTLTKFDPTLTFKGTRNLNFDMSFKTGWDQCHFEDYQIFFPMTIHRSKSKLKQLRYPENCVKHVSTLPKAITFDPTAGCLISLVS